MRRFLYGRLGAIEGVKYRVLAKSFNGKFDDEVKGIVSIALFLMLAITLLTGLEGGDSEGNGLNESSIHIASATALGLLAIIHIMLNGKMLAHQIKTLLGIK
jgi:hypothetical protein